MPRERESTSFFQGRIQSFPHAFRGVGRLLREPNVWLHVAAAVVVLVVSHLLRLAPLEWAAIVFAIVLVLGAEAFNTALEHLADALMPDHHPLVGSAKDLGAAGVLIAAIGAAVIGVIVLGPHLWHAYEVLR
jgi:diacylglycerol kinase